MSGYLITTLLRVELDATGTISLGQFYLRRTLRILPPFYLVLALLFYGIFRPVSRRLSLAASACGVAGCTIGLYHYVLRRTPPISSIPFGALFILLTGVLIVRSTFLPRILGWLMVLSGIGWLLYLLPATPKLLSGNIGGFDFFVELLLALWLLIKGVDLPRWNAQASASASA